MSCSSGLRPGRILLGCMFLLATRVPAQEPMRPGTWRLSLHVDAGMSLTRTDWTIAHPVYTGSGRITERIYGTGNRPASVRGGVEFRKDHVAVQANVVVMSSRLTLVDADASITGVEYELGREWEFRAWRVEGAFVFFPLDERTTKAAPWLSAGAGFVSTSGDTKMSGYSFAAGCGLRYPVAGHLDVEGAIRGQYLRFGNFDLQPPSMTPDLVLKPLALTFGLRIEL
jgi:hypothetical protein